MRNPTKYLPAETRISNHRWFEHIDWRTSKYPESVRAAAEWLKANHERGKHINVSSLVSYYNQRERNS